MARTVKALTHTEINNLKPRKPAYDVTDSQNLIVRVMPSGEKYFYFRYNRPSNQKRNNISLGQFPYFTLQQARQKRDELKAVLSSGADPAFYLMEQKAREKYATENTLQKLAERWREKKRGEVIAYSLNRDYRRLERVILADLGHLPIDKITPHLVIETIKKHYDGEYHAIKRLMTAINQIMRLAMNLGLIEFNKCQNVLEVFPKPKGKNHPAVHYTELKQLLTDFHHGNPDPLTLGLFQFQLLTMTRPSEARRAEWREFDLDKAVWNIPAERMKTREAHTIPLTPQALRVLKNLQPFTGAGRYVFQSKHSNGKSVHKGSVNDFLHAIGYKGKQVAHGLRQIGSTLLNDNLFSFNVVETNLSHKVGNAVSQAYNKADYLAERKKSLQFLADFCEENGLFEPVNAMTKAIE